MVLYAATTVIIVLGTLVIFTFEPCLVGADGMLLESSPAFCENL
jgi:succinate dehydrogenase / fumarate reductase membrane anchor subunit